MFCKNYATKNAMNVYREMILKWNGFNNDDIDALITETKWEVRYNLVLIRERLMEVEEVIESEVLPVWNENEKILNEWLLEGDSIIIYNNFKENIIKDITKYDELSQIIFRQFILKTL